MKRLRLVLGDQLSRSVSALEGLDPRKDVVLLLEVDEEATYARHHKQKIVLVLSAMRHFSAALETRGIRVDHVRLEDPENTGTLTGELRRAVLRHHPDRIVATEPGEWRVLERMRSWQALLDLPVEIRPDGRFLCSRAAFEEWANGLKSLRMEFFYRRMRKETGWLLERKAAPLASVEGFLRQILGWREFVRGLYWLAMPAYQATNFFAAERALPGFYWSGETPMSCLRETVASTRRNAYAHHIQRLMTTGNFALLAGIAPAQVEEW